MEIRADRLTRQLRRHDKELYVECKGQFLCVYRKTRTLEMYEYENVSFAYSRVSPHFVFALTDNWTTTGNPVDWGIEPIMAHLKFIDIWSNPSMVKDLIKSYEKRAEDKERSRRGDTEAQMAEMYPIFKRAFADINTSSFRKTDRRRNDEKKHL